MGRNKVNKTLKKINKTQLIIYAKLSYNIDIFVGIIKIYQYLISDINDFNLALKIGIINDISYDYLKNIEYKFAGYPVGPIKDYYYTSIKTNNEISRLNYGIIYQIKNNPFNFYMTLIATIFAFTSIMQTILASGQLITALHTNELTNNSFYIASLISIFISLFILILIPLIFFILYIFFLIKFFYF